MLQALDFYKSKATAVTAEARDTLERISIDTQENPNIAHEKIKRLDKAIHQLQDLAEQNTHLLEFVSLNMAAVRKILKKLKKHVEPLAPVPGFLCLEIQHPHDPSFKMSEVRRVQGFCRGAKAGDSATCVRQCIHCRAPFCQSRKLLTWKP